MIRKKLCKESKMIKKNYNKQKKNINNLKVSTFIIIEDSQYYNTIIQYKYLPNQQKKVINIMLEKKGHILTKLRII